MIIFWLIATVLIYSIGDYLDKNVYKIAKVLDLGIGMIPTFRVILHYAKCVISFFCAYMAYSNFMQDVVFANAGMNAVTKACWLFIFAGIACVIYKKKTVSKVIEKEVNAYVAGNISANRSLSEKEFLAIKAVDRCQRWNIKTNKEITFRFVQNTLQKAITEKLTEMLNSSIKEDRVYLYREYNLFIPYFEEKDLQMNSFLSDDYITVGDAGFFSKNIYFVLKGKIAIVIDAMSSIFSLQQAFESCADSEEMNKYLPQKIPVTTDEKNILYSPVIYHELEDLEKLHQISKVPKMKEDAPILYNKIQQGLIDENGIYKEEPDFGGDGCQDCGIHTMPEDDEEDEL